MRAAEVMKMLTVRMNKSHDLIRLQLTRIYRRGTNSEEHKMNRADLYVQVYVCITTCVCSSPCIKFQSPRQPSKLRFPPQLHDDQGGRRSTTALGFDSAKAIAYVREAR